MRSLLSHVCVRKKRAGLHPSILPLIEMQLHANLFSFSISEHLQEIFLPFSARIVLK